MTRSALVSRPSEVEQVAELDTPVALVDLDVFERNAADIHGFLAAHGKAWRPHTKAHRSPRLAQLQLAAGAVGVTCASVWEAEAMLAGGVDEVLLANHVAAPSLWRRVVAAQAGGRLLVCIDDPAHVRLAADAARDIGARTEVPLVIEVDVGMNRVGVRSVGAARELAAAVADTAGVRLAGVMGYEGHLLTVSPFEEKVARCRAALAGLVDVADALRADGHRVEIVSAGGTGTYRAGGDVAGTTESQAGGGCLMDRFYARDCHVDLDHALTLAATVVSVQADGRAVVDAGFKVLGALRGFDLPLVLDRPGWHVAALSAAHGILTDAGGDSLRVGDRIRLVPGYSDAMVFLHGHVYGHRGSRVTEVMEPVRPGPADERGTSR